MSPLAHPLLALGVLLAAAADAKVTYVNMGVGGCCVKFIMDIPPRPVPYQVSRQGPINFTMMTYDTSKTLVKIPNHCAFFNKEIARQSVEVCNDYAHPSLPLFAPTMHALGDNLPSPVYASCGDDTECGPLFWKIEQVCRQPAV